MQTNVIIVNGYPIYRKSLKQIIESEPGLKVIGEASNHEDLFEMLKNSQPNVLVIDFEYPHIPCVLLTIGEIDPLLLEFISNGVHGLLHEENTHN